MENNADTLRWTHVLHTLERCESKLEKLAETDMQHAQELRAIKDELQASKAELRDGIVAIHARLSPLETWMAHFMAGGQLVRWLVGAMVALGGALSALAIFKEKLW